MASGHLPADLYLRTDRDEFGGAGAYSVNTRSFLRLRLTADLLTEWRRTLDVCHQYRLKSARTAVPEPWTPPDGFNMINGFEWCAEFFPSFQDIYPDDIRIICLDHSQAGMVVLSSPVTIPTLEAAASLGPAFNVAFPFSTELCWYGGAIFCDSLSGDCEALLASVRIVVPHIDAHETQLVMQRVIESNASNTSLAELVVTPADGRNAIACRPRRGV